MHPYQELDERFFWASAVAKKHMLDIEHLWNPKFPITTRHRIVTFGSCFAQHLGRALRENGFNWVNTEPPPAGLSEEHARTYNYGIFSSRTGNIYTVGLLQQWVLWATGAEACPSEVWRKGDRFYDPFRPNIEPDGFASEEEVLRSRDRAIEAFRDALTTTDLFVFTLGLTESWFNKRDGYEYPMCPGTVAGEFDPHNHLFVNQTFGMIHKRLQDTLRLIVNANARIRFLLTVSPVPLTATMSGQHVLVATMSSKSILRAVAGQIASELKRADYFPSYEIINAAPFRGAFFEPNLRSVHPAGVGHVMQQFFKSLNEKFPTGPTVAERREKKRDARKVDTPRKREDVVCEEELLEAFS